MIFPRKSTCLVVFALLTLCPLPALGQDKLIGSENTELQELLGELGNAVIPRKEVERAFQGRYYREVVVLPELPGASRGRTETEWWAKCIEIEAKRAASIGDGFNLCAQKRACGEDPAHLVKFQLGRFEECFRKLQGGRGASGTLSDILGMFDQYDEMVGSWCVKKDPNNPNTVLQPPAPPLPPPPPISGTGAGGSPADWDENARRNKRESQHLAEASENPQNPPLTRKLLKLAANAAYEASEAAQRVADSIRNGQDPSIDRYIYQLRVGIKHRFRGSARLVGGTGFEPVAGEEFRQPCPTKTLHQVCIQQIREDPVDCVKRYTDTVYAITGGKCETVESGKADQRIIVCGNEPPGGGAGNSTNPDLVGPWGTSADWCETNIVASDSANSNLGVIRHCRAGNGSRITFLETTELGRLLDELCRKGAPLCDDHVKQLLHR